MTSQAQNPKVLSSSIDSIFVFLLKEKFLTLTVIGSIFTFAFISSMKGDIIDPLLHFTFPEEDFGFMNVTIREGEKIVYPPRQIEIKFGNFFREFITWIFVLGCLYMLSKLGFPDTRGGNINGSALA